MNSRAPNHKRPGNNLPYHTWPGRRILLLVAPAIVAVLVLALALNVLTARAFGDLVVTFSTAPQDPTKAGTNHSFVVTVLNNASGQPPAEAVVFEYRAPTGVVIQSISSSVGPCEVGTEGDPSDPSICSLGNMATGASVDVSITVYVLPDVPDGTLLDHDVRAWQFGTEDAPPDNENHAFVTVEAEADLSVVKTSEGDVVIGFDTNTFEDILTPTTDQVTAGELLKYIITVTNDGPSDAQNVVVTDTLPARFDFIESVPAGCWANAANPLLITCPLNTVPATTTQQIEVVVRTRPDAAIDDPDDGDNVRTATNNVQVSSDTADPTTPNTFDLPATVNAVANLQVTKTDIPDPVLAGEEVTYEITAQNLGPSKARATDITDTLPSGLVFVRCEPVDPDEVPVCSVAGQVVTLTDFRINGLLRDDLMPDEERSFRIVAYARSNLVKEPDIYGQPDAVGNLVTITDTVQIGQAGDITDWYTANNTDNELTGVTSQADLEVRKTDTPVPTPDDGYITYDPVTNSFVYTYYLTIENLGPSDAGRVILTDTLPVYATLDMVDSNPLTAITTTGSPTGALDIRFRDDGVVIVDWGQIAGNDGRRDDLTLAPANPSLPTTRTLTIRVRVDANVAPDIGFVENRVEVGAVPGDVCPTQLGTPVCTDPWPNGYTPTPDPDLSNNVFVEQTLLVTPEVKVDKKVYVRVSAARGIDVTTDGLTEAERCAAYSADDILTLPGDELTYCYNITNEGDTWLHSITLEDPSDAAIVRTATIDFTVVDPSPAPARWDPPPYVSGAGEAQTITIRTTEPEVAVLAPNGVPDDYDHILIIRSFTVDFPAGDNQIIALGTNTARVDAVPSTKYSTPLPGIEPSGDCDDPDLVCDTDLLNDTLALPVLEDTAKEWRIFDDHDGDGEPTPGDIIEYTVIISNTGAISATGVVFVDRLYNYIDGNPAHSWVPARLIDESVSAAIHVQGRDPVTGRVIDVDVQPPDLAFGEDLLLRTQAPALGGLAWITITNPSAVVLADEIVLSTGDDDNPGNDAITVTTRLAIPPRGDLLRFDDVTYDSPIPVTFSLRVRYQVRIKEFEPAPGGTVHCGKTIVLNHGWVDYNEIDLFDQRFPQFDPADPDLFFDSNRVANNHAGTADLVYWWSESPGWPEIPEGVEPTNFVQGPHFDGPRFDDEYPRDDDDPTWFEVSRQAPCKGVDWRLQLPALETDECDTWIQIQNVGNEFTKALLVLWGEPGFCPPQSFGPLKVECTGLLRPGSAWTFTNRLLPPGAKSGIVYSMNATDVVTDERGNERIFADLVCGRLSPLIRQNPDEWLLFDRAYRESGTYFGPIGDFPGEQLVLDFGAHSGEPLAVTVNRTCPDALDPDLYSSAAYVGISTDREGLRDPRAGGFAYYAPLVWADFFGMNSIIHIQNSGEECTSVELWFQRQGDCIRPLVWDILALAPGESFPFDPNEVVGPGWQGSVWASASQPLGIVVDTLGGSHFGAYHGVPADVFIDGDSQDFSLGTQVNYAPLIYREHQGWESTIQVQNLSSTHNAKVKVYFLDNSGDIIKTVVDWICPRGSQTYFLPVIAGLPGYWVGSARIESQDWWTPGDPAVSWPRILSVVMLEKYTDPAKVARQEAVVYNALQEMGSFDWQVGPGKGGFRGTEVLSVPLVAKGNRGVTTELAIQNLNPNPGFTDFVIFIYDQNRLIDFVCEKLNEKQVEYIDLDEWGIIPRGFLGSLVISATYTNQRGGDPNQEGVGIALGAVAVERVGRVQSEPDVPGDESKAFEAFPLFDGGFRVEVGPDGLPPVCPGQP